MLGNGRIGGWYALSMFHLGIYWACAAWHMGSVLGLSPSMRLSSFPVFWRICLQCSHGQDTAHHSTGRCRAWWNLFRLIRCVQLREWCRLSDRSKPVWCQLWLINQTIRETRFFLLHHAKMNHRTTYSLRYLLLSHLVLYYMQYYFWGVICFLQDDFGNMKSNYVSLIATKKRGYWTWAWPISSKRDLKNASKLRQKYKMLLLVLFGATFDVPKRKTKLEEDTVFQMH